MVDYSFLIKSISSKVVDENDKFLLNMLLSDLTSQKDLDSFLENFDIEKEKSEKNLMLAYFKKLHPSIIFPEYSNHRLDGILNYYRFSNIKILSGFSKIGKELNAAGIPILLFKGGAMKFLRPDLQRPMGDIDFLVPSERYEEAVTIAKKIGFKSKFQKPSPHSTDCVIEDGRAIDIHQMTLKGKEAKYSASFDTEMFKRARKKQAFGVDFLLPRNEDLMFLVLLNLYNNIKRNESVEGRLFSAFDCKFFLKSSKRFDWDIFIDNAKKTRTLYQIRLMIDFLNSVVSDLFPKDLNYKIPLTKEMGEEINIFTFEWFILEPARRYKKTMHWSFIKRKKIKDILLYLFVKLRLACLDLLGKSQLVVYLITKFYQKNMENRNENI
ncbi:MAG: nucleotidyltransferase family protein [Rickettsiales bacterium]|jgi:hypothetical protein|nr:nucleotidyltransferase family protein [Rickettsiales bacterium]